VRLLTAEAVPSGALFERNAQTPPPRTSPKETARPHPSVHNSSVYKSRRYIEDNEALSIDNALLSIDNTPLSIDNASLSIDNTPLSIDNASLSKDNTPLSKDYKAKSIDYEVKSIDFTPSGIKK
jgi:hypothetical protein